MATSTALWLSAACAHADLVPVPPPEWEDTPLPMPDGPDDVLPSIVMALALFLLALWGLQRREAQ